MRRRVRRDGPVRILEVGPSNPNALAFKTSAILGDSGMSGSALKSLLKASCIAVVSLGIFAAAPAPAMANEPTYQFNIPAQDLGAALRAFGQASRQQIIYESADVRGKQSTVLVGPFAAEDGLVRLLAGTGLKFERSAAGVLVVRLAVTNRAAAPSQNSVPPTTQSSQADEATKVETGETIGDRKVERVVVTGTHIRGRHPKSSPLDIYTAEDIERTGATTTEQFIQRLPQNLGTRTQVTPNATVANREAINGVDLRGLGVGTTLILLNGRRLAMANFGQAADISLIPVSAIKRVEVLTDGASAIYGSDAIGGVVNFVLRDDFDGLETRVSHGAVTSGGLHQDTFTQTFGSQWTSGNGLISYDYLSALPLKNLDRSYATAAGPGYLTPDDERHSVLATISQDVGERLVFNADFALSKRNVRNLVTNLTNPNPVGHFNATNDADTEQYFANMGLDYHVTDSLNFSLLATYADADVDSLQVARFLNSPTIQIAAYDTNYSALDLTAMLDGTLFELPAGPVRFSLGGGLLNEQYRGVRAINSSLSGSDLGRTTTYAFGELLAPLISEEHNVPLVHSLELSIAARYTDYEDASDPAIGRDFGDSVSPKIGLVWAPFSSLNMRATYGESFRAPSLTQLDPASMFNNLSGTSTIAGVVSTVLILRGPSTQLDPETAETFTLGFDYRPASEPSFRLSGTYFNIDYEDRIGQANTAVGTVNPALAPDAVYRAMSAAQIEELLRAYPSTFNNTGISLADLHDASLQLFARPNFWIFDGRFRNLAISRLDGFDLSVGKRFEVDWGEIDMGVQLTRVFFYDQQASASSPILSVVDTATRPVDLRGRFYAGVNWRGFDSTFNVNYVDDYTNPLPTGVQHVDSWTTVDWNASYEFDNDSDAFLRGLRLRLSVQNLLDQDPPTVIRNADVSLGNPAGFDPVNANPLGRFVVVGLSKQW